MNKISIQDDSNYNEIQKLNSKNEIIQKINSQRRLISTTFKTGVDLVLAILLTLIISKYEMELAKGLLYISNCISTDRDFSANAYIKEIEWVIDAKLGIKANAELDNCIGIFLMSLKRNQLIVELVPYLMLAWKLMKYLPLVGFKYFMGFCSDLINGVFYQIQILQWATEIISQKVIALLKMLFLLFRNKYWNIIKKKQIGCSYNIREQIIGLIMLTIVCFLFPTLSIYYAYILYRFMITKLIIKAFSILPEYIESSISAMMSAGIDAYSVRAPELTKIRDGSYYIKGGSIIKAISLG